MLALYEFLSTRFFFVFYIREVDIYEWFGWPDMDSCPHVGVNHFFTHCYCELVYTFDFLI